MPRAKKVKKPSGQIEVIPVPTEKTVKKYANFVNVAHTGFDFILRFVHMASYEPETEGLKNIRVPIDVEVAIPVSLMPGLISACEDQLKKYEERFGVVSKIEE